MTDRLGSIVEGKVVEGALGHDQSAVRFDQSFASGRKVVGYLPVTPELLADAAAYQGVLDAQLDRVFRPWRYPDRNPFPVIDLFPRWTRITRWLQRLSPWHRRPGR